MSAAPAEAARGSIFVISGASGSGKTSISKAALEIAGGIELAVSYTTRPPRPGDVNGVDYHFVDEAGFDAMVAQDAFVEWAEVHGNRYGTAASEIARIQHAGRDVLLDLDVQGGSNVKRRFPDAVLIFVLPPSMELLRRRLEQRGTDDTVTIERRLAAARSENTRGLEEYDYLVVNDVLDTAVRQIVSVIQAGRCAREVVRRRLPRGLVDLTVSNPSESKGFQDGAAKK